MFFSYHLQVYLNPLPFPAVVYSWSVSAPLLEASAHSLWANIVLVFPNQWAESSRNLLWPGFILSGNNLLPFHIINCVKINIEILIFETVLSCIWHDLCCQQIMENAEINNIIKIVGLQYKKSYDDPESLRSLRYGRIMIMTDQVTYVMDTHTAFI